MIGGCHRRADFTVPMSGVPFNPVFITFCASPIECQAGKARKADGVTASASYLPATKLGDRREPVDGL